MKDEAAALCDAAEAFQSACNELHKAQHDIETGAGGAPFLDEVEQIYSERFRTLVREIYYMRKALKK